MSFDRSPTQIPDYISAASIVSASADLLRWPENVSVSAAAARHRVLSNAGGGYSGQWKNELAPHLVRPMECLSAGNYRLVVVMGPAQSGKSEVPNNWLLQSIIYDQGDLIWLQTDKNMMRNYVVGRIEPMISETPALKNRIYTDRSSDAIFSKVFRGMNVWFVWPTPGQLQSYPCPRFVVDDYDRIPEKIGADGDALSLLEARQTTFEGSEIGYVGSSPSLGARKGIEAVYREGTEESFFCKCPVCGEYFAPEFDRDLKFDKTDDPADAKKSAYVLCPSENGCIITPSQKPAMMATGVWLGPGQKITEDGVISGALRDTTIASFRIDGLIGFASWGRLAELWRRAELRLELYQDEERLRTFWNTRGGKNYVSENDDDEPLAADALRSHAGEYELGTVPPGVVVLTATVDVGGRGFDVSVKGWGEGLESWLIDRFRVVALSDGRTEIDPANTAEHWGELLRQVLWRKYPLASDPSIEVPVMNAAIDIGGIDGVHDNAINFWHMARKAGVPETSITLIKGGNDKNAQIIQAPTFLEKTTGGSPDKTGARVFLLNVHRIKNMVDRRLRVDEPGAGYMHFPIDAPDYVFDELLGEEKQDGAWVRVAARNETFDLEVYHVAALSRHAGERRDMDWVYQWARVPVSANSPSSAPTTKQANGVRRRRRIRTKRSS